MAAPKPQPTALKVLKGTARKDRLNKKEPKVKAEIPIYPDWLTEEGKRYYQEISAILDELKVVSKGDRQALAMMANTYAEYRDADEAIKKYGLTYKTTNGSGDIMFRARPEVAIRSDASKRLRGLMTDFGLTPSSRSKVSSMDESEDDPFDSL